jgi:hypothetical protein
MKSDLAIATLIRYRLTELGLSRGEFAKRLGYKNIAKGIRRIDVLCEGNIEGTKQFMDVLPQALETSAEIVTLDPATINSQSAMVNEPRRHYVIPNPKTALAHSSRVEGRSVSRAIWKLGSVFNITGLCRIYNGRSLGHCQTMRRPARRQARAPWKPPLPGD